MGRTTNMSFYKNYPNRKDWRKQYYDSRRFDTSCKNHKSCSYCESERLFKRKKLEKEANDEIKEFYK